MQVKIITEESISAILSTFIKLPIVVKTFVLSTVSVVVLDRLYCNIHLAEPFVCLFTIAWKCDGFVFDTGTAG